MIISRTPFRVSFLGGGTDLPWFYKEHGGGAVISAAINQFVYITCHPMFDESKTLVKYSQTELVEDICQIKHPILREALNLMNVRGVDIGISADIPAGTGLGSSSSFTVGLINALAAHKGNILPSEKLAELACEIELEKLLEPIGLQDQFAAAIGGLNLIDFPSTGPVEINPIFTENGSEGDWIDECLILVRTPNKASRSASDVLQRFMDSAKTEKNAIERLVELTALTKDSVDYIKRGPAELGELTNLGWALKTASNPSCTNNEIDSIIEFGLKLGAFGAKLLGAGESGFILFVIDPERKHMFLNELKRFKVLEIKVDKTGSCIVYNK